LRLPGKRVAVKVLHGVAAADREAFARFRREAEIASRIGHPNIVQVHDFNVLPSGTPYLVLELLDGEDLAHRLTRGPLPLEEALAITRQIGAALHAAHKADVVHRDLKPGNIFLASLEIGGELVDQVKVLDFGISKIRGSQTVVTQESAMLGTPQYMAPEQALGKNSELDARTDVFALGAIVYEMLSGQALFAGSSLAAVVYKVVFEPTPPLQQAAPHVPASVAAAVEQALAKDPAQRFGDVGAFVTALTGRPLQTLAQLRAGRTASEGMAAPSMPVATPPLPAAPGAATTGARGQLSPAIPPTAVAGAGRGSGTKWVFLAAAVAVFVAGGLAVAQFLKQPPASVALPGPMAAPTPVIPAPAEAKTAPAEAKTAPTEAKPAPTEAKPAAGEAKPATAEPDDEADEPATPGAAVAKGGGTGAAAAHTGKSAAAGGKAAATAARQEALSASVASALAGADPLVDSAPNEAIRLARRTLTEQKSSRAFAIITRSFCKLGDLGNARANLHNVASADRARVLRYCKAAGTDLQ
jgi:serine/threonine-protein kinase